MPHLRIQANTIKLLAVLSIGCGPASMEVASEGVNDAHQAAFHETSPEAYLAAVFDRYRNAASYHDRGVVRLGYAIDGRPQSKTAPLTIWFDQNRMYVEAYDVRILSDARAITAWICDPETNDFDSQVLRHPPLERRPTLKAILSDPILATRISAGLAGPPPQLEWLFAAEPMKQLLHGGYQFEFGPSGSIDGGLCRSVRVHVDQDVYQFWIDEGTGVIRRVDLPPVAAPPHPTAAVQRMSLSLELIDASFETPRFSPDAASPPSDAKFVERFIPLPPIEPPRILGFAPGVFSATDTTGKWTISQRGGDRELTILVRYSGDRPSMLSAAQIARWNAAMPPTLRPRVGVGVLVDERARNVAPNDLGVPLFIDRGQSAARSLDLAPGAVVILDGRGRVAWTQRTLSAAPTDGIVRFGAIVGDLLDGVDVPQRVRKQWEDEVTRYRNLLRQATTENATTHR